MDNEYQENMAFEAEARRVAEAIWQLEPGQCQPEHYRSSPIIRELDGIARLRDVTHLMMATVSRRLEKAREDVKKLNAAERIETRPDIPVVKWLITKYQLDAEHINHARKNNVTALTLDQFRNRFFNGKDYLTKRRKGPFGSARNLSDGTITIPEDEYVELPMMLSTYAETLSRDEQLPRPISVEGIAERLIGGELIILMAPFGAGKSLTTREVFLNLMKQSFKDQISIVPLAINLREHWGQDYGDEILERHARSIGFSPKENLTIAWRAGIISLLIDGFDEVASQVVAKLDKVDFMRDARYQALQGARDLISKVPSGVGVLVCGRDHYFDNLREMVHAFGITGRPFSLINLGEFNEEQAAQFLQKKGLSRGLPDWLPRKPLILGYLAHRGLLEPILNIDSSKGFGYAWNEFLRLICEREAAHERATMDPETVRRVLERLACDVRATIAGTGPITGRELADAYQLEVGQVPGEGVLMQLQRLPGLTEREQDPGARSFIDEDMLAALQGSAIARYVFGDIRGLSNKVWLSELAAKGIAMASYLIKRNGAEYSTVAAAAIRASQADSRSSYEQQIAADCVMTAIEMAREAGRIYCGGVVLDSTNVGTIDLEDMIIDRIEIRDSLVNEVILGPIGIESSISFRNCIINRVSGIASTEGLPNTMFIDCEVSDFDDMSTNTAVLRSPLPPAMKALVTILRKLYRQAGAGRKINALKRGISQGAVLNSIESVLQILEREKIVAVSNDVVHPTRRQTHRVRQILNAPNLSKDTIVLRVKQI